MGKRVLRTELCEMLGIEYPILSAGMGPNLLGEQTGAPVGLVVAISEAGGHTGRVGTMALVPAAIDAARPVPVLAAGGIGDGRGLAAALAMGCVGIWVGTRFLATTEGGAPDIVKQHITEATDEDTRVSTMFTGKTLRALYSSFHADWEASGLEPLSFPTQILIASTLLRGFIEAGVDEHAGGFAGQASVYVKEIKPAGEVLEDMVEEAVDILTRRLPASVKAE